MQDLNAFLRNNVPITQAMGIRVEHATAERFELSAPLAPNRNDKGTAFAGTSSALATLCGALYSQMLAWEVDEGANLVIARSTLEYPNPAREDLRAICRIPSRGERDTFSDHLKERKKAKWQLQVSVESGTLEVVRFEGLFVALL